jgi:hypothetical protein
MCETFNLRIVLSDSSGYRYQVFPIWYKVDLRDLSKRLNLSPEDGEKWIVTLIRETRSDAKIDFVKVFYMF